jgi:hypothetical protein
MNKENYMKGNTCIYILNIKFKLTICFRLNDAYPNNEGQQLIEDTIWASIQDYVNNPEQQYSKYFMVLGPAGTGKTALMKKLQARCRSQDILIQCCASTTLAALMTEGGKTAHSLFKYPVIEDDDEMDENKLPECRLDNTERLALLNETVVVFWDEFISNHRYLFEAVQKKLFHKLIFVCTGDFAQILPVIPNASAEEIMNSTILYSNYWPRFTQLRLTENMRILNLANSLTDNTPLIDRANAESQIRYNNTLLNLSKNISSNDCEVINVESIHKSIIALSNIQYITEKNPDEAISWLYPNNIYDPDVAMNRVVLCSTNEAVDIWNQKIQELNDANIIHQCSSRDEFNEVDDPNGNLAQYLTPEILNSINSTSVPPHLLNLKVNDVCLVIRPMMCDNIATNMRVKLLQISPYLIRAEVLTESSDTDDKRVVFIPRYRFKFRMKYGSFEMLRTQFPLRLAYAMTINKAQGQTLENVLFDCRSEPFSHGHTYVAMSRVRNVNNIKLFVSDNQLYIKENTEVSIPKIPNYVYQQIISLT